ncbi:hypothetical protein VTL71DRAFT_12801 [Oculimacula yallundae]|uniref:C3H1-type domain-containing protein n=1 Tax=Oculimacula yallundae TaxID=86028 RepID=A0ABR4CQT0_9HELO
MSDQDLTLATVPADGSPSPGTSHTPDLSHDLDTEMTCPLTLLDSNSNTSRTSTPDKMNNFNTARDRNSRMNPNQGQFGGNNMGSGPVPGNGNWRQNVPPTVPGVLYQPPVQYNPTMPMMGGPPPHRATSILASPSVPLSTVFPGAVFPSQDQLNTAFGYAIRRGENSFTRLVPADEYPINGVPPYQGPQGLIILPATVQPVPTANMPERMVPLDVVQNLPSINAAPLPPARGLAAPVGFDNTQKIQLTDQQQRIDSIVNQSSASTMMVPANVHPSSSSITPVRRREKKYCDKWIHEGTCAFTQLGCKYLHDMPMDRATQLTIGLNHGLPGWFKREKEIRLRPDGTEEVVGALQSPFGQNRIQGPWRRDENRAPPPQFGTNNYAAAQTSRANQAPPQMGGNMQDMSTRGYGENVNRNFGPIAPPNFANSNPYAPLKHETRNR